jgi:hypothetical protein
MKLPWVSGKMFDKGKGVALFLALGGGKLAAFHLLRLRYSLRALLVFLTLFMLWGGYHTNRGWRERQAETLLTSAGARLERGANLPVSPYRFIVDARVSAKLEPDAVHA